MRMGLRRRSQFEIANLPLYDIATGVLAIGGLAHDVVAANRTDPKALAFFEENGLIGACRPQRYRRPR